MTSNDYLISQEKYVKIEKVVHYSSDIAYYEGGAKNPLKGTSLKFLVCAQNAQLCVFSGSKDCRDICNGIHRKTRQSRRLYSVQILCSLKCNLSFSYGMYGNIEQPVLSESIGISIKEVSYLAKCDVPSCYEITIAKKTNSRTNILRKTSRMFIQT